MTSGTDRNPEAAVRPVSEPTPGTADAADLDWSVGRVADRLGIPTATLRTWDRRYGVGPSQRTAGGHRRYSEEDIRRVRVMSRFIDKGVPAQSAARVASAMDTTRLQIETAEDHPVNTDGDRDRVVHRLRSRDLDARDAHELHLSIRRVDDRDLHGGGPDVDADERAHSYSTLKYTYWPPVLGAFAAVMASADVCAVVAAVGVVVGVFTP